MEHPPHLSQATLNQLIDSEFGDAVLSETAEHLKRCQACQRRLDSLAAQPDQWSKVQRYLKDAEAIEDLSWGWKKTRKQDGPGMASEPTTGMALGETPATEVLGRPRHPEMLGRIGEFDIESEVGRGGMGVVYKAHDRSLHRVVAIKTLAPHLAENGTARKRFAQEAIAAAGVIHPNVIAIHGVNDQGKTPYMVMPFVNGVSLQSRVASEGPLEEIDVVRIALQISAGLAAAHSQGLVHRDIKPANILVESGIYRVVITDFGLARAVDDASMTQTGWLTGTPNYMSPEQTRGDRPDHRSDLFSLGSTLYFLVTGHLPFRAETPLGVLNRIQHDTPTSVQQYNQRVSRTLADVIDRLLVKHPDQRFQSAAELHGVLEQLLAHLYRPDASPAPDLPSTQSDSEKTSTPLRTLTAMLVGLASLAIVATVTYWSGVFLRFQPGNGPTFRIQGSSTGSFGRLDYSNRESDGKLLIDNATNFLLLKRYDEAIELFEEATNYPEHAPQASYNLGCVWALKGDADRAIDSLTKAVDLGFQQVKLFRTDDDLNTLRNDVRFKRLMERLD